MQTAFPQSKLFYFNKFSRCHATGYQIKPTAENPNTIRLSIATSEYI